MFPSTIAPGDGMRPSLFINIRSLCRDVNYGEPESSILRTETEYRIPRRGQGTPLCAMAFPREPPGRISERSLPKCLRASMQPVHSFQYFSNSHVRNVSCPSDYVHSKSSLPPTRRRQIRKEGNRRTFRYILTGFVNGAFIFAPASCLAILSIALLLYPLSLSS